MLEGDEANTLTWTETNARTRAYMYTHTYSRVPQTGRHIRASTLGKENKERENGKQKKGRSTETRRKKNSYEEEEEEIADAIFLNRIRTQSSFLSPWWKTDKKLEEV